MNIEGELNYKGEYERQREIIEELNKKIEIKNKTIENLQNELNYSRVEIGSLEEKVLKYKTKAKKLKKKIKKIELIVKCDYLNMCKLPIFTPPNLIDFDYENKLLKKKKLNEHFVEVEK